VDLLEQGPKENGHKRNFESSKGMRTTQCHALLWGDAESWGEEVKRVGAKCPGDISDVYGLSGGRINKKGRIRDPQMERARVSPGHLTFGQTPYVNTIYTGGKLE